MTLAHQPQICFTTAGVDVVISAHRALLDRIERFFAPYYTPVRRAARQPAYHVSAHLTAAAGTTPAPVLDMRSYLSCPPETQRADGSRVFIREDVEVRIEVDGNRHVRVFAPDPVELEFQLRMLLRDQVLDQIERNAGAIILHAAAVERNGAGFVFLGNKNSGKTTSLLTAMKTLGCRFVSGDWVKYVSSKPAALVGVPARVNIHNASFKPREDLHTLAFEPEFAGDASGKNLVDANRLVEHFGVSIAPRCTPMQFLFPTVAPHLGAVDVSYIPEREERYRLLAENLMGFGDTCNRRNWLRLVPPNAQAAEDHARAQLRAICVRHDFTRVTGERAAYMAWIRDGLLQNVGDAGRLSLQG